MNIKNNFVIIDWGSTNFRAFLLNKEFNLLDEISSAQGIKKQKTKKDYFDTLKQISNKWFMQNDEQIFILSGMVGSNIGLQETKQIDVPITLQDLRANIKTIKPPNQSNMIIYIIPGIKINFDNKNNPDVIRGEEIQAFGGLSKFNNQVCVIPGTHSKWIFFNLDNKSINYFKTYMSGELFELIKTNSVIAKSILPKDKVDIESQAFFLGVEDGKKSINFTSDIFLARSKMLKKEINANEVLSYLSGFIISYEFNNALDILKTNLITLIADIKLLEIYNKISQIYKIKTNLISTKEATILGITNLFTKE